MFSREIAQQSQLLADLIPCVVPEKIFALKGGTALNFFWLDLPRLSVDLDLVFLPSLPRSVFLSETEIALQRMADRIRELDPSLQIQEDRFSSSNTWTKLYISDTRVRIKVEVATGHRECIFPTVTREFHPKAVATFGAQSMQLLSFAETCAGKFNAALDRQHPRDMFDVKMILESHVITDQMRTAFVADLLGQGKALGDLLAPRTYPVSAGPLEDLYRMLDRSVPVESLIQARYDLYHALVADMPEHHKDFLVSFVNGSPEWTLLEVPGIKDLPAVQWRILNLAKVSDSKRQSLLDHLLSALAR